ncbi:MAG TPA: nickel-binding protein [Candidatus Dormibacteraeota bacterium]
MNCLGPDGGAAGAASREPAPSRLVLVDRRLPRITDAQLALLHDALLGAAGRYNARGEDVRYVRSIYIARQERVLSLFDARSPELVREVNEAALVPFTSIDIGVELADLARARHGSEPA